jgi:hypothetical protein
MSMKGRKLTLITRAEWGAKPPTRVTPLSTPVREIWIHHGAGSSDNPIGQWKGYQSFHMDVRGWSDIAYNFGIGKGGEVLEGRGALRVGGGTGSPQDQRSYSVCFIGNFEVEQPTTAALDACGDLLADLIDKGLLTRDFTIHGDREVNQTACPGRYLYPKIEAIRQAALTVDDDEGDDMSLTVNNLRTGETAYRAGESWAIRFVQQVLSLPAVGTYVGPKNGRPSAVLDQAVADAKQVLLGREDASPTMGADLWRAIVAQGAQLPLEPAIVPDAKCEAKLAEIRRIVGS